MLIWMRNSTYGGIFKAFLMGLLVLAVAGLVMMDVGGFFRGTMSSGTVAKGGGINISIQEFDQTVRRVLSARGIGPQEAYQLGLIDEILSSEIQGRLFSDRAQKLGLEISDENVMAQISKLAEPLAANGQSKKDALSQILRQQNISEAQFVESIREEMGNTLLRAAIQPPITLASPLMAKSLYRYDNEKRSVDVIVLKNSTVADVTKPTDEQIQNYYDANKVDFLIPESRTITVATLKKDMAAAKVTITDEDLRAEYDRNISAYTKPPRRAVSQIVLNTEDEAKKALEDVRAGKAVEGFDKQTLEENGLLPEIAGPVFDAKKGDVVGPIETTLGWHILRVDEILASSVTPFADVKSKLREDLEHTQKAEAFYKLGTEIEDRAAGGDKLEDIVQEYGMTTEIIGPFRRSGNNADGKDMLKRFEADRGKVIEAAFDFDAGEIAPVVETADGQYHLIRVDQIIPDAYRDLSSVRASLETRWINEQKRLANSAKAKTALENLNTGKSLSDVAKELGASVQTISGIGRTQTPPSPLTPVVAAQIFATDVGKAFSSEIDGGFILGTPTSMTMPAADSKVNEDDLKSLKDITGRGLAQDVLSQYAAYLTANKKIKINQPLLERIYGTPAESQP